MSSNYVSPSVHKEQKAVSVSFEIFRVLDVSLFDYELAATPPRRAKLAFALASIEQLVPVLSDKCIRDWVWGICYP